MSSCGLQPACARVTLPAGATLPARSTLWCAENGEAIQILKYVDGQKYEPHTDYFRDK